MNQYVLGLGSNSGDRFNHLQQACHSIARLPQIVIEQVSPIYSSPAWGIQDSPDYFNACLLVSTRHSPHTVLGMCLGIESALGRLRDRQEQYAPRVIDIDVLFSPNVRCQDDYLELPHPRLHMRAFALVPAIAVCQDMQLLSWLNSSEVQQQAKHLQRTDFKLECV